MLLKAGCSVVMPLFAPMCPSPSGVKAVAPLAPFSSPLVLLHGSLAVQMPTDRVFRVGEAAGPTCRHHAPVCWFRQRDEWVPLQHKDPHIYGDGRPTYILMRWE